MAEPIDTNSEEWRAACEARHVANMPDDNARRAYLAGVRKARGKDTRDALRTAAAAVLRRSTT